MSSYVIEVKVETTLVVNMMGCVFWFTNPLNNETTLIAEYRKDGESNMKFIKRIKEYINSKVFIGDLRAKMESNYEEHNKENELKEDYNVIKEELDGMTFTVNVDMDN